MSYEPPVKLPLVAAQRPRGGAARLGLALAIVGGGVFALLAHNRAAYAADSSALPPLRTIGSTVVAPSPLAAVVIPQPTPTIAGAPVATVAAPPPLPPMTRANDTGAEERAGARIGAPALIVDLAARSADGGRSIAADELTHDAPGDPTPATAGAANGAAPTAIGLLAQAGGASAAGTMPGSGADPGNRDLSADERFAVRAGRRETDVARAYSLPDQDRLVPLGTVIGAVMESALNSDVPGFARAITTRDVLSFDGSQVVIPAGSHVVGEYKSGVALGASRIFIVWTRLVRPDGVAVALASPATDDLGGGGLGGKVNRHFLQRYGGAVLLSVLTGGINALTQSLASGSTVVVSTSSEATSLASQAARGTDIPPTIKTRQGAAVRIFVARDLDFSGVGPVR